MVGCRRPNRGNHSGIVPEKVSVVRYPNSLAVLHIVVNKSHVSCLMFYLQSPEMEADVRHRVAPHQLWDVIWEPEVSRD